MKPFLKQVAEHYYASGDIEHRCFIFPNRRALLFFRKWLSECVAQTGKPVLAPAMFTMNDFIFALADRHPADRLNLILVLYDCYKALYPKAEELDDFIFWGDVLLSDFDDVDKYLIDPSMLFTNVAQFKNIRDNYSYMSEAQRAAVKQFVSNFTVNGGLSVDLDSDSPGVKEKFLQIWDILYPLYNDFRAELDRNDFCYEGMAYREIAEKLSSVPASDVLRPVFKEGTGFVFVGLNALNECEKKLLSRMRDASLAEFCWDYSSPMIKNSDNRSSFFMSENVLSFHQAFEIDSGGLENPIIEVVGVPSSTGGAKQLPRILSEVRPQAMDTAIVLPDENLLVPVLNSIPPEIGDINVTMGYPMKGSEFYALMNEICALQMHLREKNGRWHFYHRQVWAVFSNSVIRAILDEDGRNMVNGIRKGAKYYIPQSDFAGNKVLETIFRPVVKDVSDRSGAAVKELSSYLLEVVAMLGNALKDNGSAASELDFAREYYQDVNRLSMKPLAVLPQTFIRLLGQTAGGRSVPFRGEPLKGLQIMGPLETRALDFDNIIVLSCNEGVFPRSSVSSSFIPPELRRGFGLPTYEYQDAVWAYYFYRMIQRARRVWLIYDSRAEGLRSGEESRYIKQLELHFGLKLNRVTATAPIREPEPEGPIVKTEEDMLKLQEYVFSASSMQNYISCPAKFYFSAVKGLSEEAEVEEVLDAGKLGNVLHKVMQDLYTVPGSFVSGDYLKGLLKRPGEIRSRIDKEICRQLNAPDVEGRNIIFASIIGKYVMNILRRDSELLDREGVGGFRILSLEHKDKVEIHGRKFKGFIDRLDSLHPGTVRVSDYKTGKVTDKEIFIDDSNAAVIAEEVFNPALIDWPKIALQLFIYDKLVEAKYPDARIFNSLYPAVRLFVGDVQVVECSQVFMQELEARLSKILDEIYSPDVPFERSGDSKACEYCDFKMLCGK